MDIKQLAIITLTLVLIACSVEYDKGFNTTDKEYMQAFLILIKNSGISYQEDQDGMLRYKSKDEQTVSDIHKLIKEKQSKETSVKYDEPEAREYFKGILDNQGIEYKEELNGSNWIKWYPENEEQKNTIQMQVVQYMFDLKAGAQ